MNPPRLMNDVETAEVLCVSLRRLRQLCRDGSLPYVDLGDGEYRFDPTEVADYIEIHRVPSPASMLTPMM